MKEEDISLPNQNPTVKFHTVIRVEISGRAPAKEKEPPFLPESFFEYLQALCATYQRNFKDSFFVVSLAKEEQQP